LVYGGFYFSERTEADPVAGKRDMRKLIGVKSWFEVALHPSLKRDALLFDQIAIPDYKHLPPFLGKRANIGEYYVSELEWLREQGLIIEPADDTSDRRRLFGNEDYQKLRDLEMYESNDLFEFLSRIEGEVGPDVDPEEPLPEDYEIELIRLGLNYLYRVAEHRARRFSLQLSLDDHIEAYPVIRAGVRSLLEDNAPKTDVVQIVFDSFPTPDDSTSWPQILDYRQDPDSRRRFTDLRHWMTKFASGKFEFAEAHEEIEHLMHEYENHLKLHKLKVRTIALGVVFQLGAAWVDKKVGPVATGVATYLIGRLGLLEGESKAPGKEVAYIVETTKTFS
jgi:hypothetical protein